MLYWLSNYEAQSTPLVAFSMRTALLLLALAHHKTQTQLLIKHLYTELKTKRGDLDPRGLRVFWVSSKQATPGQRHHQSRIHTSISAVRGKVAGAAFGPHGGIVLVPVDVATAGVGGVPRA